MSFKFQLGVYVTDMVTGFSGCIVARMDNITACNRYCLQPKTDKDGKFIDPVWIDEHSLQIDVTSQRLELHREARQPPG